MSFLRYISLSILLFVFVSNAVFCQEIKGKVVDANNQPLVAANVILYENDSTSMLSYSLTDKSGDWEIEGKIKDGMVLKASYIGYKSETILLTKNHLEQDIITISLRPKNQEINEVVVEAKKFDVITSGDTISYDVTAFRRINDQTLGDVLKNMPGIDVDNSGNIEYNGKRIDKLLLDGKDILNNQHKLTSEGLQSDDIESIQIIKNYRPFDQQHLPFDVNKIAMNILLTDEAKNKIQGDTELLGGYKNAYEASSNMYRVREKTGLTAFFRSNNVGEDVISVKDFINLQGNFMRVLNETKGDFSQVLPEGFTKSSDVQQSNDNVILLNYEKELDDKNKIRIAAMGNYSNINAESIVNRYFAEDENSIKGTHKKELNFPYMFTKIDFKTKSKNDKRYFSIELPFYTDLSESNQFYTGEISGNNSRNGFYGEDNKVKFAPEIRLTKRLNDNESMTLTSINSYERRNEQNNINQEVGNSIDQENNQTQKVYSAQLKYSKTVNKIHFQTSLHLNNYNNDIQTKSTNQQRLNTETRHNVFSPKGEVKLKYKSEHWLIEPVVSYQRSNYELGDTQNKNQLVNSSILIRYQFYPLHSISLSSNIGERELPYNFSNKTYDIVNDFTLRENSLALGSYSNDKNINLIHFWFERDINLRFHTVINYSLSEGSVFQEFTPEDGIFVQKITQSENQKGLNLRFSSNWKWAAQNLSFKTLTNLSSTKIEFSNYSSDQKLVSLNLGVEYEPSENVDLEYGYNIINRELINITSKQSNSIQSHSIGSTISSNKFRLNNKVSYNYFNSKTIENSNWNLDIALDYSMKNNWTLKCKGNNLLNLTPQTIINTTVTPFYYETIEYQQFPGTLTLGVKKLF